MQFEYADEPMKKLLYMSLAFNLVAALGAAALMWTVRDSVTTLQRTVETAKTAVGKQADVGHNLMLDVLSTQLRAAQADEKAYFAIVWIVLASSACQIVYLVAIRGQQESPSVRDASD